MIRFLAGVWLAVLLAVTPAYAQKFPEHGGKPVVDQAGLLTPAQVVDISSKAEALHAQTGRAFVIATVNSLDGRTIEDYGNGLIRAWKVGDEKRDDGVILIVAPKEKQVRIETGYGAEGFLPDILAGRIIRDTIVPRFKAGDMGGGVAAGADEIIRQMSLSPDEARQNVEQARVDRERKNISINPIPAIFIVIVFFVIIGSIARAAGGKRYRGKGRRGGGLDSGDVAIILWGLDALTRSSGRGGGWGGGGWSGGDWGGGGGGFGGFGGGSGGGGGASGSW